MYNTEIDGNVVFIMNDKRRFKILDFEEPYQIKIVEVTYGDINNGGLWTSILEYLDEFKAQIIFECLKAKRVISQKEIKVYQNLYDLIIKYEEQKCNLDTILDDILKYIEKNEVYISEELYILYEEFYNTHEENADCIDIENLFNLIKKEFREKNQNKVY